ncbi:Cof-type HAD-IIB family hydrolase [soil metagenome]
MLLDEDKLVKRFKDVKLIVSDVDGTLLNHENELTEYTIDIIKKLQSKGILFTLATQRIYSSLSDIIDALDISIPVISVNGAYIRSRTGEVINRSVLKPGQVRKAIELSDNTFVRIALCSEGEIVFTDGNSVIRDFMKRVGTTYKEVESYDEYLGKTLEVILMGSEKHEVKKIFTKMKFPYTVGLRIKYYKSAAVQGYYNLEILKNGISKKTGLKHLANHLNLKKDQVVVMGDWYNDRDLFEFGGLNVALQNAVSELKSKANYITERTNDEEGVAHFLQMIYDNI